MGFDRKTIRFGALHKEIKSNLPKDLRFGASLLLEVSSIALESTVDIMV